MITALIVLGIIYLVIGICIFLLAAGAVFSPFFTKKEKVMACVLVPLLWPIVLFNTLRLF